MTEIDYSKLYYKRFEKEPTYKKVLCTLHIKKCQILTESGVVISSSGDGISIQYKKRNGGMITSTVFKETQYLEEYYRISNIAESECLARTEELCQ